VDGNLPVGAVVNSATNIRPSIMESFTTHNPNVCITQDDLEAVNTLYPVCTGAIVTPVCDKSDLNIGQLRMVSYVIFPGVVGLLLSILFHTSVHSKKEAEVKKMKQEAVLKKMQFAGKLTIAQAGKAKGGDGPSIKQADAKLAAAKASELPSGVEVTVM